ncbi:hypothetical protein BHE74_00037622 [Ensete ventricosum]|nr:hypothetical protein GW17_00043965 [Ensete ventricosum]RWW55735.1 hypothetical protein BHE74_00037622 [Ensete ventricosum]RZR85265.1 hypothetical protein BHM03_00012219 [Ensete ventricosum]
MVVISRRQFLFSSNLRVLVMDLRTLFKLLWPATFLVLLLRKPVLAGQKIEFDHK